MRENIAIWIAWRLPHWLVRWCYFRVAAHATQGQWGNETPDSVNIMTAAGRWEVPHARERKRHSSPLLTAEEGPGCKPPTSS